MTPRPLGQPKFRTAAVAAPSLVVSNVRSVCPDVFTNKLAASPEVELAKGAEANGYPNELWTLKRVADVIERLTGVTYHPARVWYILRQNLKRSWQRPARRATERNEEAIHQWVKRRWPAVKKGRGARTH